MAVPFSNTRLRVPKGFQNVLEGLAREVLRCQPENIYSFAADYFEELLRKRQETGFDDIALLGAKLEDRFYNNHSFKNPNTNTNNEEQQSAAVKIQSEYRRFAAKKEVDSKKEEEAAIVIQASFRGHVEREKKQNADVELNNSPVNPEADEVIDIDLNDPEVEKAAVKIQSVYKGFRSRKTTEGIPVSNQTKQPNDSEMEEDTEMHPNVDQSEIVEEQNPEDLLLVDDSNQNNQGFNLEDSQNMSQLSEKVNKENDMKPEELQNDEEIIDIDLNDPDVEKAAVKIQSAYKGFRTRKANEDALIETVANEEHFEDTEILTVANDEENPEEMQTLDESQMQEIEDENVEEPNVENHVDLHEKDEKAKEDLEFDQENQELFNDEITNVTDNNINEAEQIHDVEIAKSSIDSNENVHVNDAQESADITEIQDDEIQNDNEEIQQSNDFTEREEAKDYIGDEITEANEDTLNTDRITERSQENIDEDAGINFEQNEEVKIEEMHKLETEEESVENPNIGLDGNIVEIEEQQEHDIERLENIESHNEENTNEIELTIENPVDEKEVNLEENTEKVEDNTVLFDEADGNKPVEAEETINETIAEAVDTERTIENNDLEDTINDHEDSNQIITNPAHEDNQESGGLTNDADDAITSRTEPDE